MSSVVSTLVIFLFIQPPKAGYLLMALPGVLWATGEYVEWQRAAVVASVALGCVLSWFPYELLPLSDVFTRTRDTVRSAFLIDAGHRVIVSAGPRGGSASTGRAEGLSLRTLQTVRPGTRWNTGTGACWIVTNPWETPPEAELVAASPVFVLWQKPCAAASAG